MSPAARSVFLFGLYLVVVGLTLIFAPNFLLRMLHFSPAADIWPRVIGVLALVLAHYYIQAARHEVVAFFRWTIAPRVFVAVTFTLFVVLHLASLPLLLLGGVDLAAALWTAWALRPQPLQ